MARNLDILVGLVVQGWERGALNAEEVVRTLQRVELEPNVATGTQHSSTEQTEGPLYAGHVPPAATAGEPGEMTFLGGAVFPKPAKPE